MSVTVDLRKNDDGFWAADLRDETGSVVLTVAGDYKSAAAVAKDVKKAASVRKWSIKKGAKKRAVEKTKDKEVRR